jgi:ERCC4-type nuclease
LRLDAVTLTVGDFVVSPLVCVERKSISDLFGSFKSGRLFHQAEAMSKCEYPNPNQNHLGRLFHQAEAMSKCELSNPYPTSNQGKGEREVVPGEEHIEE